MSKEGLFYIFLTLIFSAASELKRGQEDTSILSSIFKTNKLTNHIIHGRYSRRYQQLTIMQWRPCSRRINSATTGPLLLETGRHLDFFCKGSCVLYDVLYSSENTADPTADQLRENNASGGGTGEQCKGQFYLLVCEISRKNTGRGLPTSYLNLR